MELEEIHTFGIIMEDYSAKIEFILSYKSNLQEKEVYNSVRQPIIGIPLPSKKEHLINFLIM